MRNLQTFLTALISATVITATFVSQGLTDEPADVPSRPATLDDLTGTWRMVDMQLMHPFNRLDPFVLPHQRYYFTADGRMKVITSTPPFTPGLLEVFDRRRALTTLEVGDGGKITITSLAWRNMNRFTARLVTSGQSDVENEPRVGDLILSWPGTDGSPVAIKLMRKVATETTQ